MDLIRQHRLHRRKARCAGDDVVLEFPDQLDLARLSWLKQEGLSVFGGQLSTKAQVWRGGQRMTVPRKSHPGREAGSGYARSRADASNGSRNPD